MPSYKGNGVRTIRGSINAKMGGFITEELIFNYESPDRTRGWVVDGAFVWIADPTITVSSGGNALMLANLATDSYEKDETDILNPDDNRSIGWHSKQYHTQNGTNDFIYPNSTPTGGWGSEFLIDIERIVTNDLFISVGFVPSVATTESHIDIGYMVVLREVNLSAGQSLLQQLKGIGQNIDN